MNNEEINRNNIFNNIEVLSSDKQQIQELLTQRVLILSSSLGVY